MENNKLNKFQVQRDLIVLKDRFTVLKDYCDYCFFDDGSLDIDWLNELADSVIVGSKQLKKDISK